jgi:hypothetical protein
MGCIACMHTHAHGEDMERELEELRTEYVDIVEPEASWQEVMLEWINAGEMQRDCEQKPLMAMACFAQVMAESLLKIAVAMTDKPKCSR